MSVQHKRRRVRHALAAHRQHVWQSEGALEFSERVEQSSAQQTLCAISAEQAAESGACTRRFVARSGYAKYFQLEQSLDWSHNTKLARAEFASVTQRGRLAQWLGSEQPASIDSRLAMQSAYSGSRLPRYWWRSVVARAAVRVRVHAELLGAAYDCGTIDYQCVRPEHVFQLNALLFELFWPGIDVRECLMAPEFAVVATWKRLVIGCVVASPLGYVSFVAVRHGWRRLGVARSMMYFLEHAFNTARGTAARVDKIALHVSTSNGARFFYRALGFRAQRVLLGFYNDYFSAATDDQVRLHASRDAILLELKLAR